jgi:hypothetical protein
LQKYSAVQNKAKKERNKKEEGEEIHQTLLHHQINDILSKFNMIHKNI